MFVFARTTVRLDRERERKKGQLSDPGRGRIDVYNRHEGKEMDESRVSKMDLAEIRTSEPISAASAGCVRDSKEEITPTTSTTTTAAR